MASPSIEVLTAYDFNGAPLPGLTPVFDTYRNDLGTPLTPPAITEIGGGGYRFTPDLTDSNRGIFYIVDLGATAMPRRLSRYIRPEDFAGLGTVSTQLQDLWDSQFGNWRIFTTGADANRLVIYKADGITVVKKFDLLDANGLPTAVNPYRRVPVP